MGARPGNGPSKRTRALTRSELARLSELLEGAVDASAKTRREVEELMRLLAEGSPEPKPRARRRKRKSG